MKMDFWSALKNKRLIFIALWIPYAASFAQGSYEELVQKHPGFTEVVLKDSYTYSMTINAAGAISAKQRVVFQSKIVNQQGAQNNQEEISFSSLHPIVKLEAYTLVPNGNSYKKIKAEQIVEKKDISKSSFHDDYKLKVITFPALDAGTIKVYEYESSCDDPYLLGRYVFGNGQPTLDGQLVVEVDPSIELGFKVFNDPNRDLIFDKKTEKGKVIYTWQARMLAPLRLDPEGPGPLHVYPHVLFYIDQVKTNGQTQHYMGTAQAYFNYNKGLIDRTEQNESPELEQLTREITAPWSTHDDKMKAILYWVKDHIKYVAFEEGYGGYIPRGAAKVFHQKFGDCKDMANLLVQMARYAQIPKVYLAWIGTTELPYKFSDIATMSTANHMIAVYQSEQGNRFLDATNTQVSYGFPSEFIQGKEALLHQGDHFEIVQVPYVDGHLNQAYECVSMRLDPLKPEQLIGEGKVKLIGFNRDRVVDALGDTKGKERMELLTRIAEKGHNKFNLTYCKESEHLSRDLPYELDYSFQIDNYVVSADNDLYVGMQMDRFYEGLKVEAKRKQPYNIHIKTEAIFTYELDIPKGYHVTYIPPNFNLDNAFMQVQMTYVKTPTQVILHTYYTSKTTLIQPDQLEAWNQSIELVKNQYTETLKLSK